MRKLVTLLAAVGAFAAGPHADAREPIGYTWSTYNPSSGCFHTIYVFVDPEHPTWYFVGQSVWCP